MTEQRRRQIENSFKTLSEAALYAIDAEFRANGDTVLEAMTQAEICSRARDGFDRIRRTRAIVDLPEIQTLDEEYGEGVDPCAEGRKPWVR